MSCVSADGLVRALASRHAGDVFVPECKDGPTHSRGHRRLDAWVLMRTWSPLTAIGYEVKVSRADWLQDQKFDAYRSLCHLFYIVAPKGVVRNGELPDGVGLLEPVGAASRLVTRRKAVRADVRLSEELLAYVLMFRTRVTRDFEGRSRREILRDWAADLQDRHRLSSAVHGKILAILQRQEDDVRRAEQRVKVLEHVEARIRELGFDPAQPVSEWEVSRRLRDLSGAVHPQIVLEVKTAETALRRLRDVLQAHDAALRATLAAKEARTCATCLDARGVVARYVWCRRFGRDMEQPFWCAKWEPCEVANGNG